MSYLVDVEIDCLPTEHCLRYRGIEIGKIVSIISKSKAAGATKPYYEVRVRLNDNAPPFLTQAEARRAVTQLLNTPRKSSTGGQYTRYNIIDSFMALNPELTRRLWVSFKALTEQEKHEYNNSVVLDKVITDAGVYLPLPVVSTIFESFLADTRLNDVNASYAEQRVNKVQVPVAQRVVSTVGELRQAVQAFTDGCPITPTQTVYIYYNDGTTVGVH